MLKFHTGSTGGPQNNLPSEYLHTLLDTLQAARILDVTPRTLEVWRCTKRHQIPYIKVGRLVKYRREDLEAWLTINTKNGGAQ